MAVIPNLSADRRIAAVIRRLELDVNRRLDGVLHGDYLGLVPGEGSDLGECRQYAPGDDVRRIDWNVSARNSATYVRETIADRELESWLIVDQSPSLQFGTSQWEKRDVALAVATGMGVLTSRGGNRIGAIVGVGSMNQVMPPGQGRTHLLAILHQIAEPHPASTSGPTLIPLLERANAICKRRGSITILSDWKEPIEQWRPLLGSLAVRHHVIAATLHDPRELELPNVGVITLVDVETGTTREVNTSRASIRKQYAEAAAAERNEISAAIIGTGAQQLDISTEEDWLHNFARFITETRKMRARGQRR